MHEDKQTRFSLNLNSETQRDMFVEVLSKLGIPYITSGTIVFFKSSKNDAHAIWALYIEDFLRKIGD